MPGHDVFLTGGTGYLGCHLVPVLAARGHRVRALVRPSSRHRLPEGARPVDGDALDGASFRHHVAPADTFVHLVGVPRPTPLKARQFREVDLAAFEASLEAAVAAQVRHFVFVSVAQPAPVMRAYVRVRAECEAQLRRSELAATVLRPWYVLGPGHQWPRVFIPLYRLFERVPATAAASRRLGLVSLDEMTAALAYAVEHPSPDVVVLDAPRIRQLAAHAVPA